LGLINTVLDIAKVESGQFILNMAEYAIETYLRPCARPPSDARNKKLALTTAVAKSLPVGLGDEQRLTRVLGARLSRWRFPRAEFRRRDV
jgi:hypothetical protein